MESLGIPPPCSRRDDTAFAQAFPRTDRRGAHARPGGWGGSANRMAEKAPSGRPVCSRPAPPKKSSVGASCQQTGHPGACPCSGRTLRTHALILHRGRMVKGMRRIGPAAGIVAFAGRVAMAMRAVCRLPRVVEAGSAAKRTRAGPVQHTGALAVGTVVLAMHDAEDWRRRPARMPIFQRSRRLVRTPSTGLPGRGASGRIRKRSRRGRLPFLPPSCPRIPPAPGL